MQEAKTGTAMAVPRPTALGGDLSVLIAADAKEVLDRYHLRCRQTTKYYALQAGIKRGVTIYSYSYSYFVREALQGARAYTNYRVTQRQH